jgi:Tol biopolymer transport system component
LKAEIESGELHAPVTAPEPPRKTDRLVLAVAAVLLVAAVFLIAQRLGTAESGAGEPLKVSLEKLTSLPGAKRYPTLSPDGKTVAYAWEADHNWDIFMQRVGGENPINLTRHEAVDEQPAFSPDGERIVFRSDRDGGGLFLMGATGESVRRLTDDGFNPSWSPDGSKVFYSLTSSLTGAVKAQSGGGVWMVDVRSGEIHQVHEGNAGQPHCSPNRHRIAYWALHRGGRRDIWTIPVDGGEPVLATDHTAIDWNPVWAPDGRHLYFLSDRGGSENLWRVPIDEQSGQPMGEPEAVTQGGSNNRWHVTASADGRQIAFVESIADAHVWRIGLGADEPKAPPERVTSGSMYVYHCHVSPDGQQLALIVWGPQQRDLFVRRVDGGELRQLTDDIHKEWWPTWSPDGKQILFKSDRSGQYEVWVIRPDGSGLRQVTETPGGTGDPIWLPDERVLYPDKASRVSAICDSSTTRGHGEALPAYSESIWFSSCSPDGRWLAGTVPSGIVIFSLEAREYERVTDLGGAPLWLNDSRRLLFRHERKIMLLDVESKEMQDIAEIDGRPSSLSVTRDNRWVYFRRHKAQGDIWLATLE